MKRRTFLQGCCAGIVAMNGARLGRMAFAAEPASNHPILINVFLRGGMDALSFLVPHADAEYHDSRPRLRIASANVLDLDGYFGLHPSAAALRELFDAQHLAVIGATGIPDGDGTRSHFEAQDYLEYGGRIDTSSGWMGRLLAGRPGGDEFAGLFRGLSFGSALATSMYGFPGALAMNDIGEFTLRGGGPVSDMRAALRTMYAPDPAIGNVALRTLDAIDVLDGNPPGTYEPSPGVAYGDNDFARGLSSLAQLVKMQVGLQAATIDLGGWDTHESQANNNQPTQGSFADLVGVLSGGLHSFWTDLAQYHGRLTVVVMSEFGRRLKENDNRGTDHGHGGIMMVLDNQVVASQVFGPWPGLTFDELYERKDLRVTTDFRTVLGEVLTKRLGATPGEMSGWFPGYSYPGALGFLPNLASPKEGFRLM